MKRISSGVVSRRLFAKAAGFGIGSAALGASGCFLIDVDSFRGINFTLPPKSYVIDPEAEGLKDPPVGQVPALSCTPETVASTCCQPPGIDAFDCKEIEFLCENNTCTLNMEFTTFQTVNLLQEVPSLRNLSNNVLMDVFLKKLSSELSGNSLNVPLPPVDVYVAPMSTTTVASGSGALFVVRLPAQAAGWNGSTEVVVPQAGQQAFSNFASQFRTPFNILTSLKVVARPGDLIPQGRATIKIGGQVEARV